MAINILDLTGAQLQSIYYEDGFYIGEGENEEFVEVNVIESGDWEVEHKCESSTVVFEYEGKYYRFYLTRWGSYWQGYETDEPDGCEEVVQAEKVITYWRAV